MKVSNNSDLDFISEFVLVYGDKLINKLKRSGALENGEIKRNVLFHLIADLIKEEHSLSKEDKKEYNNLTNF